MVVHVDQVKVDEAAPRPPGPHGDVQVLHRVRRQRKHTPGVRLGTAGEAGWGAVPALCRPHAGSPTPAAQAAERPPREPQRLGRWGGPHGLREGRRGPSDTSESRPGHAVRPQHVSVCITTCASLRVAAVPREPEPPPPRESAASSSANAWQGVRTARVIQTHSCG